eukprot:2896812-Pleurochrysis_carterae.AAC.1
MVSVVEYTPLLLRTSPAGKRRMIEPIHSTGRVTPLATLRDAHVGLALRDGVGGEQAAITACRASGTTINESHWRNASNASRKRRVGNGRGCRGDWDCVGTLKENKKSKEQC